MAASTRTWVFVLAVLGACGGGGGSEAAPDSGAPTAPDDEVTKPGPPSSCEPGFHLCDDECVPDRENDINVGCRLGCGDDACPYPINGGTFCNADGLCEADCSGMALVGNECVDNACAETGSICGIYVDGEGREIDCGTCLGGATCNEELQCDVDPDEWEPNDSRATAVDLGTLVEFPTTERMLLLTFHLAEDEDWFVFRAVDGAELGNPAIDIALYGESDLGGQTPQLGWMSWYHEVTAWFACDTTDDGTEVSGSEWFDDAGTPDDTHGVGWMLSGKLVPRIAIRPECSGLDDSGTVLVRVRQPYPHPPEGERVHLSITVD